MRNRVISFGTRFAAIALLVCVIAPTFVAVPVGAEESVALCGRGAGSRDEERAVASENFGNDIGYCFDGVRLHIVNNSSAVVSLWGIGSGEFDWQRDEFSGGLIERLIAARLPTHVLPPTYAASVVLGDEMTIVERNLEVADTRSYEMLELLFELVGLVPGPGDALQGADALLEYFAELEQAAQKLADCRVGNGDGFFGAIGRDYGCRIAAFGDVGFAVGRATLGVVPFLNDVPNLLTNVQKISDYVVKAADIVDPVQSSLNTEADLVALRNPGTLTIAASDDPPSQAAVRIGESVPLASLFNYQSTTVNIVSIHEGATEFWAVLTNETTTLDLAVDERGDVYASTLTSTSASFGLNVELRRLGQDLWLRSPLLASLRNDNDGVWYQTGAGLEGLAAVEHQTTVSPLALAIGELSDPDLRITRVGENLYEGDYPVSALAESGLLLAEIVSQATQYDSEDEALRLVDERFRYRISVTTDSQGLASEVRRATVLNDRRLLESDALDVDEISNAAGELKRRFTSISTSDEPLLVEPPDDVAALLGAPELAVHELLLAEFNPEPAQPAAFGRAECAPEHMLVFGGRTNNDFDIAVCTSPAGELEYIGIDTVTGDGIRLAACLQRHDPSRSKGSTNPDRYFAVNDDTRYIVTDSGMSPSSDVGVYNGQGDPVFYQPFFGGIDGDFAPRQGLTECR